MGNYKKISKLVLVVVGILTLFFGFFSRNLKFDYDFESFFAQNDPDTEFFNEHRDRFESDNDFIFISLENEGGVLIQNFY